MNNCAVQDVIIRHKDMPQYLVNLLQELNDVKNEYWLNKERSRNVEYNLLYNVAVSELLVYIENKNGNPKVEADPLDDCLSPYIKTLAIGERTCSLNFIFTGSQYYQDLQQGIEKALFKIIQISDQKWKNSYGAKQYRRRLSTYSKS